MATPEAEYFNLPFKEAVEYFKQKGYAISPNSWRDVWQAAHAHSFTVARVTAMDVLEDIRGEVQKALDNGTSLGEFKRNLMPMLDSKGWWRPPGEAATTVMPDGTIRKRLTPWRMETIYRTNLGTAYAVGSYKQNMEVVDRRPWWQYLATVDSKTRDSHAAMNLRIYRWDDPIWKVWRPKNGFNCRCEIRTLSDFAMNRQGLKPSTDKPDELPDEGWQFNPGEAGIDAWKPGMKKYGPEGRALLKASIRGAQAAGVAAVSEIAKYLSTVDDEIVEQAAENLDE